MKESDFIRAARVYADGWLRSSSTNSTTVDVTRLVNAIRDLPTDAVVVSAALLRQTADKLLYAATMWDINGLAEHSELLRAAADGGGGAG